MAVSRYYSRGNMFSAIFLPTVRMKNIRGILSKKIACPCVFFSVCLCFRREREKKRLRRTRKLNPGERERSRNHQKLFPQLSLEESCPKPKKPSNVYNAYSGSYLSPSIPMLISSAHNAYPIPLFLLLSSLCAYE